MLPIDLCQLHLQTKIFSCLKYLILNLSVRGAKIEMFSFSGIGPFSPPSLKRWKVPRPCWKSFCRFSSIFLLIHFFISDLLAVRVTFSVLVFPGSPVILSACFCHLFWSARTSCTTFDWSHPSRPVRPQ